MAEKTAVALNWSGGKDEAMAFLQLSASDHYEVSLLITTFSESNDRVSMHGIRASLLEEQAKRMNLPLKKVMLPENVSIEQYNAIMENVMRELKLCGIRHMAYGDIFLEDLKDYREQQLKKEQIEGLFPLWGRDTTVLLNEIEKAGIKAMVVCVRESIPGAEFLGDFVNIDFSSRLPASVDPCGEKGEYHTFVLDAPFFSAPLKVRKGAIVHKSYGGSEASWDNSFYFLDLIPES